MALATYADIKTEVAVELNRTDISDTTLTRWIAMAESQAETQFMANGPVRQMMGRSDATIASEFIALPTDFLGAIAIYLASNYRPLDFISPEEIVKRKTLYPNASGDPTAFSVVDGELQFWPWTTGGSFTGEMTYWKKIPPLSNTNTSNWLLAAKPDAYFYGTCAQSGGYLMRDMSGYLAASQAIIAGIIQADKASRTAPHLSVGIVAGGTP